jgi:hypothetical protein
MAARGRGRIVNVASTAGTVPRAYFSASGAADALSGRYLDVETDDVAALGARAEEIRQRNLLTLRIAI